MEKSKPKRYEISTIEQFVDVVTPENFERIIEDFAGFLAHSHDVFAQLKESHPEYRDKSVKEIADVKFIWIDDGKTGLVSTELTNKETGKKKIIKHKK